MRNKKIILVGSVVSILIIVVVFMIFTNFTQGAKEIGFLDIMKTVHIKAKYSQLRVDVQLKPDNTCVYSISNDPLEYNGKWKLGEKKKDSVKILVDVSRNNSTEDYRINRTITLYDEKKSKGMAAVPVQFMKGKFMTIYGEWKQ